MDAELHAFLRHLRLKVAATTYRRKQWQIQAWWRYLAAQKKSWRDAAAQDVEAFLLSLNCCHAFRQSIRCVIGELYAFHKLPSPAAGVKSKPTGGRRLPRVPGKAAVDEIIGALAGHGSDLRIRDRLIVELAYGSGLRRDELRKLNIEDIDLEQHTAHVSGKGNKPRIVPLTENAVGALREHLACRKVMRGPLLVSFRGRRLSAQGVYQICRERIGIRPHLLRHACATHMLANGASIRVIQELLGHADLRTTQLYTAVEKGRLRQVVNERHPRGGKQEKRPGG